LAAVDMLRHEVTLLVPAGQEPEEISAPSSSRIRCVNGPQSR
jgi:hypothetical protein